MGVSVSIVTVSVVVVVILFIRLMMADRASDGGTRQAMMARHMTDKSANHRSFDASSSKGRRRGCASQNE